MNSTNPNTVISQIQQVFMSRLEHLNPFLDGAEAYFSTVS